jgi:hypothetical protein
VFVLSWHKLKQKSGLHLHPLTNNHFHFLSTVKLKSSQVLPQLTKVGGRSRMFEWKECNYPCVVSDVCCVGMHCYADWSYLVTDCTFMPPKRHLGGWQFHSNKEVEVTVYERLLMQKPELYHYRITKLIRTWNKFIDALENYVKNNYNSWICEWHVMF